MIGLRGLAVSMQLASAVQLYQLSPRTVVVVTHWPAKKIEIASVRQESRAIAGRTARCRCKFRYVAYISKFTSASRRIKY